VKGNSPGTDKYKQAEEWLRSHPIEQFPNSTDWNAAIGQEQINWLKGQLIEAKAKGEKVVVSCHYPIRPQAAQQVREA